MPLVRICRSCGTKNEAIANLCSNCMANISGVRPEEIVECEPPADWRENGEAAEEVRAEKRAGSSSETVIETVGKAVFVFSRNGRCLSVRSGDVLGREEAGKNEFSEFDTVSRRHIRVAFDGARWTVEDLGSTNGTWVNGKKTNRGEPFPFKEGDVLSLSKSCELLVKKKGVNLT